MLDATEGVQSPDVCARLTRAVVGKEAIDDATLDMTMQEALAHRRMELDAARVLPELAESLADVRDEPIHELHITLDAKALPHDRVLAVGLEFDRLFSQPMWFLFAHYREGRTWPKWMNVEELDHTQIRSDGKRVDGRLQWFDRTVRLTEGIDGTDLRDLPASFALQLKGDTWQPTGSISTYEGGPSVPRLRQTLVVPALSALIQRNATFGISLVGAERDSAEVVKVDQNDFDLSIVARYPSGRSVTLFRSTHSPLERAVLGGAYLSDRQSAIEREAMLGLYRKPAEQTAEARNERRKRALVLAESSEAELSPEERRTAAVVHYGRAVLEMFRVFGNAPPPGPVRQRLHERALAECNLVLQLLRPLIAAEPKFDDVGMAYWSANNLARYYRAIGHAPQARDHTAIALSIVDDALAHDPQEPAYRRFRATGLGIWPWTRRQAENMLPQV